MTRNALRSGQQGRITIPVGLCWPMLGPCSPILGLCWGRVDPPEVILGLCFFHDFTFIPGFCLKKLSPVACEAPTPFLQRHFFEKVDRGGHTPDERLKALTSGLRCFPKSRRRRRVPPQHGLAPWPPTPFLRETGFVSISGASRRISIHKKCWACLLARTVAAGESFYGLLGAVRGFWRVWRLCLKFGTFGGAKGQFRKPTQKLAGPARRRLRSLQEFISRCRISIGGRCEGFGGSFARR